jgi:hypothetical protein
LNRALVAGHASGTSSDESNLQQVTARLYDTHYFCPDGGHYEHASDGKAVTCSVHGTAESPRQTAAPSESSQLGRLMQSITDASATLLFLEDGLHAVVTVDRKPE